MELWIGMFASALAAGLGLFLAMRPSREARFFAAVAFSAGAYVLALSLLFSTERFIFSHAVIITGASVLGSGLLFALAFLRSVRPRDYLALLPALTVAFLAPTGLLISGARHGSNGLEPVHGPLALLLPAVALGYSFAIWILLARAIRRSAGLARAQALLVLGTFTLLLASIVVCNVLAPLMGFPTVNMLTGLSLLVFLGSATYALSVQRLFEIDLLLYRAFSAILTPASVLVGVGLATGLLAIAGTGEHRLAWWLIAAAAGAATGAAFSDRIGPRGGAFLRQVFSPGTLTAEQRTALMAERRLVADIAHGLQTPLAVLRAEAEGSEASDRALKARLLAAIDDLSGRMRCLIAFARAGMPLTDAPAPVRLDLLLTEIVEYVGVVAEERGVTLHVAIEEGVAVHGRAEDLRTLVTNLLSNALEHAPRGRGVHEAFISCVRELDVVSLTVADTGPGMSEQERQRACEPLYRAPGARAGHGMGLGLAIARQVALAHGGSLALLARTGGGLVANVRLPAAPGELLH